MQAELFPLTKKYQSEKGEFELDVWDTCSKLATDTNSLDLSQGFADFLPPAHALQAIAIASTSIEAHQEEDANGGHPRLLSAIANLYSPRFGRQLDPDNEIVVTPGADGALVYTLHALLNPGDEVIVFDPFYLTYESHIRIAEAVPVFAHLYQTETEDGESEWHFNYDELASKFSDRTKVIMLNTPHNPTGKVFSKAELQFVASLCRLHNVVVIADEVYEFVVYSPHEHVKIATLEGMWERTVTVSSAGKLLCATGWRLGWLIAPKALADNVKVVKNGMFGATGCVLQEALAQVLEEETALLHCEQSFLLRLRKHLQPIRDRLVERLKAVGAKPSKPQAGLFVLANMVPVANVLDDAFRSANEPLCLQFTRWLAVTKGIAVIPACVFFSSEMRCVGNNYIRLCFCKKNDTMDLVDNILDQWEASVRNLNQQK